LGEDSWGHSYRALASWSPLTPPCLPWAGFEGSRKQGQELRSVPFTRPTAPTQVKCPASRGRACILEFAFLCGFPAPRWAQGGDGLQGDLALTLHTWAHQGLTQTPFSGPQFPHSALGTPVSLSFHL
jgi:hypothetical protein